MQHPTRILIDPRAYQHNLHEIARTLTPGCHLCAVLKADAYGHGLEFLASAAISAGVDTVGFSDNEEASVLRHSSVPATLLRLRPALLDEAREALSWNVEECVGSLDQAQALSALGERHNQPVPVHLVLDVGINRMAFSAPLQLDQVESICRLPGIRVTGVMTHFPCADDEDLSITQDQYQSFIDQVARIQSFLPHQVILHAANSAAAFRLPDCHNHLVRTGILSYGLSPSSALSIKGRFQPVMSVVTRIVLLRDVPKGSWIGYGMTHRFDRDSRIATLPIGYAHGYLRELSNKADVLIHGIRCPIVGRISMNMTTVDVTHLPHAQTGDDVVLLGSQGTETITAEELACHANTINYEITCLLGNANRCFRQIV